MHPTGTHWWRNLHFLFNVIQKNANNTLKYTVRDQYTKTTNDSLCIKIKPVKEHKMPIPTRISKHIPILKSIYKVVKNTLEGPID